MESHAHALIEKSSESDSSIKESSLLIPETGLVISQGQLLDQAKLREKVQGPTYQTDMGVGQSLDLYLGDKIHLSHKPVRLEV